MDRSSSPEPAAQPFGQPGGAAASENQPNGSSHSNAIAAQASRTRKMRRDLQLLRISQSRTLGPALRWFIDPQRVLQLGMGFWSSRAVLTAVEIGLFTELAKRPRPLHELIDHFGWHPRAAQAFLEALVGLDLLDRDSAAVYSNSREAGWFLDRAKPSYVGGLLELSSPRLYDLWSGLEELLKSGRPQAKEEQDGK